jgi:hypothetical protein
MKTFLNDTSREFSKNGPNGINRAWRKLIYVEKPKVENLVALSL